MKNCISLAFSFILFTSCSLKETEPKPLVEFGSQTVSEQDFIKTLMGQGFLKYGRPFFDQIQDPNFFEIAKNDTLEEIVSNIYFANLANEKKITLSDEELEEWIQSRTKGLQKEDLSLILNSNNITYKDWKNLFKNQLIQHKVMQSYTEKKSEKENSIEKNKRTKKEGLNVAVLTFEDKMEAEDAYKKIKRRPASFSDFLKKRHIQKAYTWITSETFPFYSKIRHQKIGTISKPIESQWGFLIVKVKKKGKFEENNAAYKSFSLPSDLVKKIKEDPRLKINMEGLHSLKIKK